MNTLGRPKSQEQGFTLIELLVVIIIIGVLAAIAIPVFVNQQKAAQDAALKSDLKSMATALHTWFVKNPQAQRIYDTENPDYTMVMGWNVIYLGEGEDVVFVGTAKRDTEKTKTLTVTGLHFTPSPGVGIGVISIPATYVDEMPYQQFCVVGNAKGSNYTKTSDGWNPLFYDSMYGIAETNELHEDGACQRYRTKDWG